MAVAPGQTLSHYRLVEKIGEGGMGVVWKAQDTILGRTVAIKVLPADLTLGEERRKMFLDEARLASSVSDAHIAQIHELGREGDLDFIVMEFVEGAALDKTLRGRPLPPEKVAAIGEQVARALARAHRKGLLHRDIKPGNIMVTSDGEVKVVDFGLATLFHRGLSTMASDLTTRTLAEPHDRQPTRKVMGTVPYMSPEQTRGEKLDARSDVFSLGTVLYEMTTGERPFVGATNAEVASEIQKGRIRSPRDLIPKMPMELDRIIRKSLAPRPADRYHTMEDLAVDLKRLSRDLETGSAPSYKELEVAATSSRWATRTRWAFSGLLLAATLIVGGRLVWSWRSGTADSQTILVLPMEVRGQTEGADYVGRAFAEAMAISLAEGKSLTVLPVPEVSELGTGGVMGRARTARGLGAGSIVTGSLTRNGDTTEASVSLVGTLDNHVLWGGRETQNSSDLRAAADSLAKQIMIRLTGSSTKLYGGVPYGGPSLLSSPLLSAALAARRQRNAREMKDASEKLVAAFPNEPYPRVLFMGSLQGSGDSADQKARFEDALRDVDRLEPANPYTEIARALDQTTHDRRRESVPIYTRVLERTDLTSALRANVQALRGQSYNGLGEFTPALEDLNLAVRLDPTNPANFSMLSIALMRRGRLDEAITRAHQAVALLPTHEHGLFALGEALRRSRKLDESIDWYKQAYEINHSPNIATGYGMALVEDRRINEALPLFSPMCDSQPDTCSLYAIALQLAGRVPEARMAAAREQAVNTDMTDVWGLACYHALAGHRSEALRLLKLVLEAGDTDSYTFVIPCLESLHGDPEFESIISGMRKRLGDRTEEKQAVPHP